MDLDVGAWHTVVAYTAVLLGVVGPVVGILYAVRVDRRDFWRWPMVVTGLLTFAAILGAYLSGRRLVSEDPRLLADPVVGPHLEYADWLLPSVIGYVVVVVVTGLLHPRTGALRIVLPMLLVGFSGAVLVLVLLSGDSGVRQLLDRLLAAF